MLEVNCKFMWPITLPTKTLKPSHKAVTFKVAFKVILNTMGLKFCDCTHSIIFKGVVRFSWWPRLPGGDYTAVSSESWVYIKKIFASYIILQNKLKTLQGMQIVISKRIVHVSSQGKAADFCQICNHSRKYWFDNGLRAASTGSSAFRNHNSAMTWWQTRSVLMTSSAFH